MYESGSRLCERCHSPIDDASWEYGWCPTCAVSGRCTHGERPEDCNDCLVESDREYDARRRS